ncbi:MAG: inositol monophosphatase family protein [Cyanobacteria bacterium P01_H01_bin.15]
MPEFWTRVYGFTRQLAESIGQVLAEDAGRLTPELKADGSLVTAADKWADGKIRQAITKEFPEHGILSEETSHTLPSNDWCWVVDPIDGTTNFTRGLPLWAISIGLLYQGTPIFGLVHLPQLKQTFHGYWYGSSGIVGPSGAFLNHQPIQTTSDEPSPSHLFNLCARSTEILNRPFSCKVRMVGVASYNILLVAAGAAIGGIEASPKIWDIAAASVILQAAGGLLYHLEPNAIFPLTIGLDYGSRPFPSLALSRPELRSFFEPQVAFIGERVRSTYRLS